MTVILDLDRFIVNLNACLLGDIVLEREVVDLGFQVTDPQSGLQEGVNI